MFVPCVMAATGMFPLVAPLLAPYGEVPFSGITAHDVLTLPSFQLAIPQPVLVERQKNLFDEVGAHFP